MSAATLLTVLRDRGCVIVPASEGRLLYRPHDALTEMERADVARHRQAIVDLLVEDPVGWRREVMATQLVQGRVIPLLVARPGLRFGSGTCCSCGDRLGPDDRYRCRPCVEAVVAVLAVR